MSSPWLPWEFLRTLASSRALSAGLGLALLAACGGGAAPPAESPHETSSSEKPASSAARDDDESESSAEPESAPAAAACNDATCFSCGSGYCPTGWYCDESGSGGAACSWLPDCGKAS